MQTISKEIPPTRFDYASWVLAGAVLLVVLKLHLVVVLICGFIIYEMVYSLTRLLVISRLSHQRAKIYSVVVISTVNVVLLSLMFVAIYAFFPSDSESISALFAMMAEILEGSQQMLPAWITENMPKNAEELKSSAVVWLKTNAGALPWAGKEAVRITAHIIIGIVLGAIVSLMQVTPRENHRPLARALMERVVYFHLSFRQIVFAQARIAGLNTFFTWLYLGVALPVLGIHMPFMKTLVAITFFAGLLPVVGNLISCTIIVVVSLSISPLMAVASIVFLVVIHELEYFLNAHIIGSHIKARAWELLLAMLIMEAAFGLSGLVVAPIYYAYIKNELCGQCLI
jgi:predicted PurR-regulated permease PerM